MLRALIPFSISLFLACSSDSPPPTSPAGKISAGSLPFPTNLRVEAITRTSARLLWDSVGGATDYDISYKKVGGGKWKVLAHRGTATSARLSGLEPSTEYRWTVKADSGAVKSRWAVGVNFTTLAASPGNNPIPIDTPAIEGKSNPVDNSFTIELIFDGSFTLEQKYWLRDVAKRWERYFYDAPDYVFNHNQTLDLIGSTTRVQAGERIDDLRIYVGPIAAQHRNHPGWDQEAGGLASVIHFREEGILPVVAVIQINEREIERSIAETFSSYPAHNQHKIRENMYWKQKFHHELGHAFGIGQSPAWANNVVEHQLYNKHFKRTLNAYFFVGPNALREYRQIHPKPHPKGIPVYKSYFTQEIASHLTGGIGGREHITEEGELGWTLFQMYWNFADGGTNISRVERGIFEDIGWSVNYELPPDRLIDDDFLERCWVNKGAFSWFDFRIDCF